MSESPKKLSFGLLESHCIAVWHAPVTITVSDYPELEGMTEEEMKSYIQENFWDMKPIEDEEESYSESLYDDLTNMYETKDKIYDEEKELFFVEVDEDEEEIN